MYYSATYDPADDKLRLSATSRLDAETYARVKAAGFSWAPKQGVFYAVWSPLREDLCTELAGEIGDEDTTLVERAEVRAERFEGYQENRTRDADHAHAAVHAIADGIPLGQPILVGHHSERHARRDAEKIENGMRRAVKMWDTAQYWKSRAAGALAHAKYLERPDVRARRIKTIEAEIRQQIASYTPNGGGRIMQSRWNWKPSSPDLTVEQRVAEEDAARVMHVFVGPHGRGGHWVAEEDLPRIEASSQRYLAHLRNRLEYEKAMLAEGGGLAADKFAFEIGGQVTGGRDWYVITGLNRKDGRLLSLSVIGRYCSVLPVEEVTDYRPPAEGDAEKVKAVKKLPPLVNFRAPGCVEMTTAEWKQRCKWSDSYFVGEFTAEGVYNSKWNRDGKVSAYRLRTASGGGGANYTRIPVFLTDAKVVEPPKVALVAEPVTFERPAAPEREPSTYRAPEPTVFDAMKESLKAGVQVVSAPQLFPTPPDLAARMVEEADIESGMSVLEPSAGTGVLMDAARSLSAITTGVEVNLRLVQNLRLRFDDIHTADFLTCNGNLGKFDRVLMNPPFADGQDIEHVRHAYGFLKPGGRLVAIMCEGPFFRQDRKATAFREWLDSVGGTSEQLPKETFQASGTGVNTRLVVIDARKEATAM